MNFKHHFLVLAVAGFFCAQLHAQKTSPDKPTPFNLQADAPGRVDFFGSENAALFSKEVTESFKGVLTYDFVSEPGSKYPLGFINASPASQPWYGTMWTRDAGTCMRELVYWGYYQHACQVASCVMDYVGTNSDGYIAFPRLIDPQSGPQSGSEMDGQASTIIAMVALWQRLPANDPFRAQLYQFLHQKSSPVRSLDHFLKSGPLIPGSGEFGGGSDPKNLYCNVVQNNLCALALLSAANMEEEAGDHDTAKQWREDANTLFHNIEKYLVSSDGSWVWCIDSNLQSNPEILKKAVNVGFGGLNGPLCMSPDVLGFDSAMWPWQGVVTHGEKTFDALYNVPIRKVQFDKYGMWPQFDTIHQGLLTGASYGQGYALQTMLVLDKMNMADHGLDFLAHATFDAKGVDFPHGRLSPYYFYERIYSPDAQPPLESGCGPLNLVNVAEPLKIARLIVGVDDTSTNQVEIIPRLPPSWSGYRVENWPIRTSHGIVRADISCERKDGSIHFSLKIRQGGSIPN